MSSAENPEKPEKTKRVLTEAQLEVLKLARGKAMEKRKQLGDVKRREKELKEEKLNNRIEKIKQIEEAAASAESERQRKLIKKKKVAASSSSSSAESERERSSSSESESESEEEIKPRKVKAIPTTKARVKKVSHEALTNEVVRQELKERIMKQNYINAFASIFPGKINPYS